MRLMNQPTPFHFKVDADPDEEFLTVERQAFPRCKVCTHILPDSATAQQHNSYHGCSDLAAVVLLSEV